MPSTYMFVAAALPLVFMAQAQILTNNKMRFGTGAQDSVDAAGVLQQPFYFNSGGTAKQLTFSDHPLSTEFKVDETGPAWSDTGGTVTAVSTTIDYSGFIETDATTSPVRGHGSIKATTDYTFSTDTTFTLERTYTLADADSYLAVTIAVTAATGAAAGSGGYLQSWVGTEDDWIGDTDAPTKKIGTLNADRTDLDEAAGNTPGVVLKISSGDEALVMFGNGLQFATTPCCGFSRVTMQDPATTPTLSENADHAYAAFRAITLEVGSSFTVGYGAVAIAELADLLIAATANPTPAPTPAPTDLPTATATVTTATSSTANPTPAPTANPTATPCVPDFDERAAIDLVFRMYKRNAGGDPTTHGEGTETTKLLAGLGLDNNAGSRTLKRLAARTVRALRKSQGWFDEE